MLLWTILSLSDIFYLPLPKYFFLNFERIFLSDNIKIFPILKHMMNSRVADPNPSVLVDPKSSVSDPDQ